MLLDPCRRAYWSLIGALLSASLLAAAPHSLAQSAASADTPKTVKVLVVAFDPVIQSRGGLRLHEVYRWGSPRRLVREYVEALRSCSGGYADYRIVEFVDCDYLPIMTDGFQYSVDDWMRDWDRRQTHRPDAADFAKFATDRSAYHFNRTKTVAQRVASGEIDEVFVFAVPGAPAFWESAMAGPNPFFINGAVYKCPEAKRNFAIMGFNYERGVDCMLENFCHRTECSVSRAYAARPSSLVKPGMNNWERFALYDQKAPGEAGCGNCHFAPSSQKDYDWGNPRPVYSTCDDWLRNWPNLTGQKRMVDRSEWGNGDMRLHHIWWLSHLPKKPGVNPDGLQNNWWKYIVDLDAYGNPFAERSGATGRRRSGNQDQ